MPATGTVKFVLVGIISLLIAGGIYLWAVRGQAILLDLASGVSALLCL